jgi:hypothetical protein
VTPGRHRRYAVFIPDSPPPRQEGMAASFITSQVIVANPSGYQQCKDKTNATFYANSLKYFYYYYDIYKILLFLLDIL